VSVDEFDSIVDDLIFEEANGLLDRQKARCVKWRRERIANGEGAELRDLIVRVHSEPNKRGPVLAAYSAALWRLMEQEGTL
jgi:hypothetical protein